MTARVSVIVPVYNGERYLAAALASVAAQTIQAHEVLVLDDGSTDASAELARSLAGVRVESRQHRGKSAAMNAAIPLTSGDLIAFLDCDDLWAEHKLQVQLAVLEQRPDCEAVFALMREFVSPDTPASVAVRLRAHEQTLRGYAASAALIRRATLQRVGPFDESLAVGEFIDWYARARDAGVVDHVVEETLVQRRLHEGNMGRTEAARPQNLLPMLRQVLARRRK